MVDSLYIRGWEDCLEALTAIIQNESRSSLKHKVETLRQLVRENKFERIRFELGAFDIF
jgi:hypothetical protein